MLLTDSGGAGPAFPAILRDLGLPRSVLDSYDVIGMDPRGVGHSTPVTCGLKPEQPALRPPLAWSAKVRERAKELENGSWGAAAVNTAVTRTAAASAAASVAVITAVT
ncbi:hypothetical protein ACWEPL_52425 [Nonomuraea sp. NPDC004186]